jgi:hypothetical protein
VDAAGSRIEVREINDSGLWTALKTVTFGEEWTTSNLGGKGFKRLDASRSVWLNRAF